MPLKPGADSLAIAQVAFLSSSTFKLQPSEAFILNKTFAKMCPSTSSFRIGLIDLEEGAYSLEKKIETNEFKVSIACLFLVHVINQYTDCSQLWLLTNNLKKLYSTPTLLFLSTNSLFDLYPF